MGESICVDAPGIAFDVDAVRSVTFSLTIHQYWKAPVLRDRKESGLHVSRCYLTTIVNTEALVTLVI